MPDDETPRRRRENRENRRDGNPGRRESDRLYESVCEQLDEIRSDMRTVGKYLADLARDLRAAIDAVEDDMRELIGKVERVAHERITGLERWHIEETAVDRERAAAKIRANERRSKWATRLGIPVAALTLLTLLIDLISRLT